MEELDMIQQDVDNVAEDIRSSYKNPIVEMYSGTNNGTSGIDALLNATKQDKGLREYSDVKFTDAYQRLNSGDYVAKYPNISVTDLDQEERLAQQQSTSSKWTNGLTKFLGKIATGILGGTIGTVTGLANLTNDFSLEATYDNSFNRWLDDLNTKMDYKLPNYYSQAEKDKSLFAQVGTANFWANDVLGGAAFTVSAIGSEAIWAAATGGTSLATSFARLGARTAGLYSKGSKALKAIGIAKKSSKPPLRFFSKTGNVSDDVIKRTTSFGKAGELINTARFTYTSAGFEAGFEARHFMNEEKDKFEQNFERINGRAPTTEDREKFYKDLTEAANNLFTFNLALVGGSNMAIFGKLYNVKSPFKAPKKYLDSKLFGIGNKQVVKNGKEQLERVNANSLQKFARGSYSLGKAGFTEGFLEEGGQGMGGSTAGYWVESGYDVEKYKAQLDISEAMADGFSEAYGTKEGQKEVLIGTLIGLITGTGVNLAQGQGLFGDMKAKERNANLEYAYRKEYTPAKVIANLQKGSRISKAVDEIEEAENNGDTLGGEVGRKKLLMAHIVEAEKFDFSDEAQKDFTEALNRMEDSEIQEQFGLDSLEDAQEYKQNILSEYSQLQSQYKKYREFTEYYLADVAKKEKLSAANTEVLKEAIAVELALGENINEHAGDLLQTIKEELTQGMYNTKAEAVSKALTVEDILSSASKETRQKFRETRKELKQAKNRLKQLDEKRLEQAKTKPAEELNKTVAEIEELQEKVRILEAENEAQLSAMVLENPFRNEEEFITSKDLEGVEENIKYIEELMKAYKDKNPQKYAKLNILLRDYATAKEGLKRYSDLNNQLSDPSLGLRGKRNLIKELMLDKEPNEITIDLIRTTQKAQDEIIKRRELYTAQSETGVEEAIDENNNLTEEELKQYEDKGEVTQTAVTKLAKKRKEGQDLTEQETKIYNEVKDRVDKAEVDLGKTAMEAKKEPTPEKDKRTPIQKIIDDNKYLVEYLGTEDNAVMPTPEELEEYKELLTAVKKDRKLPLNKVIRVASNYFAKRGIKTSLNPTQLQRFKDLNQKVQDFQLYKQYQNDEGISLAELIEQQVSLEQEASDTPSMTKELTEDDHIQLQNVDQNPAETGNRREDVIQVYEGSKVRKEKEGYMFSNLKLFTFLSRMKDLKSIKVQIPTSYKKDGKPNYGKPKSIDLKDVGKYEGLLDVKIIATAGENKVTLTNKSRARINVKSTELDTLLSMTGLKVYKNALEKSTYSDIYEQNEEGKEVQKTGDFEMQDESGEFKGYSPQQAYETEPGSRVRFIVNRQDKWNKDIRKLEGKITRAQLVSMVKIYVQGKGGAIFGDAKSAEGIKEGAEKFMQLREAAADALLASTTKNSPVSVELPYSAKMSFTFLGTPVLEVQDGKPIEKELTDEMLEEVEDFGVMEKGTLKLNGDTKVKGVRQDFVSKLQNAPVIVIRKGKYLIAYPVSLKYNEGSISTEFASIMGSRGNMTKKATEINNLLAENGVEPTLYYNSSEDQNMVNEDGSMSGALLQAEETLNKKAKYTDPKTWLEKGFTKKMLKDQIKTSIDLTGKKFMSPKPVIDFKGMGDSIDVGQNQNGNQIRKQQVERISKLPFSERIPALKKAGIITSDITYNLGKRFPIIVSIAGIKVGFYRSSEGTGGKQKGAWTPMFGFGKSKGNPWLIKGDINKQVNVNYDSLAIKEYTEILNKTLNWEHNLDKGRVKNHPYFKELDLAENEQAFNEELYGIKDLGIINGETKVSGFINSKLKEINNKYNKEDNGEKKVTSTGQFVDSVIEEASKEENKPCKK